MLNNNQQHESLDFPALLFDGVIVTPFPPVGSFGSDTMLFFIC